MQAAFLRVKLDMLDEWNSRRREVADQYSKLLANADIVLPYVPEYAEPVWHLYVIRSKQRDTLKIHLEGQGVSTVIHYPIPPHRQACYKDFQDYNLPIAELMADEALSLPMSPQMKTENSEYVINEILGFLNCHVSRK
jgi:dTDP-4-amino-4,6-dideoxygalactose transaminase